MKRSIKTAILAAAAAVAMSAPALGQSTAELRSRNRLLESELVLAKGSGSYMIIDLAGKEISLNARGMTLRKWEIGSSRLWGRRIPMKTIKLKAKSALRTPQRPDITPGKEEPKPGGTAAAPATPGTTGADLGILEIDDMPVHYDLIFDEDIHIGVRPKTKRFGGWITNVGKTLGWYLGLPIKTIFRTIKKKPFTEISIVLKSEKDAREIYWAYLDGHQTIIIP